MPDKSKIYLFPFLFLILTSCFFLPFFVYAREEEKDIDWYYDEAQNAIMDEHYEYAIKILKEAKIKYPGTAKFLIQLGDLYFEKDFYELALDEYLQADQIDENDFYTLDQIQDCYSYLNKEYKAIEYLEKILKEYPPDEYDSSIDTVDDLGWMYFKTHQLEKGEELVLNVMKETKNGIDRGLAMTLGTLYSGMYDYERSKKYYLMAIEDAEEDMDYYFASIAYYNLSLLEHTFYHFNSALQYTNDSLQSQDRATGHLSKGELYQSRMNFPEALREYEEGEKKDDTPLTKMNIAILLQIFGRLDEALQYASAVYDGKDHSWMHYFGTDIKRYKKEIHEILADTYRDRAQRELSLPRVTIIDGLSSFFSYIRYSFSSYYHRQKFNSYSLIVGKDYLSEQAYLDAFWAFYMANKDYPDTALKYLHKAEEIETALIPQSKTNYLLEQGKMTKNLKMLEQSIDSFDPFWEKEGIAEALIHMIRLLPHKSKARRLAINRLYEINPGAFPKNRIGLPLEVRFHFSGNRPLKTIILHSLRSSGSDLTTVNSLSNEEAGYRYILQIYWGKNPSFKLSDRQKEVMVKESHIQVKKGTIDEQAAQFIKEMLSSHIYYVKRD
ncbi:MAG: hypothetical protein JXB88_00195 [Spirochaetales bacterium]|nr:hypothetical protein [Spirochaetales bacterium]